jgi:hypothetical protein
MRLKIPVTLMSIQRLSLTKSFACCWAVVFFAYGTSVLFAQEPANPSNPSPAPAVINGSPVQPPSPPAAAPTATATPAPAAATAAPASSDDDLLTPAPPKTTAAPASSDDDLLAPGNPKPGGQPSSDDDLLLPGKPAANGQSMPEQGGVLFPDGPQRSVANLPPGSGPATITPAMSAEDAAAAHAKMLLADKYPSASICATCHPKQFREWSFSQHAYAQMSPVFNTMQATIDKRASGTNGDFCIRCHTAVGMDLKEPVFTSNLNRNPTSREGITCITCHRIKENYGKVSARFGVVQGDILQPMYGPKGDAILKQVLAQPDVYQVVTKPGEAGRAIHTDVVKFDPLEKSAFCGDCHDVNLLNGFRLEEAFSQFNNSPANKQGQTCQDCHMGKKPGIKSGYDFGPAATIGDKTTPPRKLTNHTFAGPDYSIIHPGLFPFNTKAQELASLAEWLQFDYKAGWGTDAYEKNARPDAVYPPRWKSIDDRYDARAILDDQFGRLEDVNKQRYEILRRGIQLHELVVDQNDQNGIKFKVKVVNATLGHGVPTGFDAERAYFMQATVSDRLGKVLFRSGDRDPNGDYRDMESAYVHDWKLPLDKYLFTLQSKFLVTLIRGGERVQILPTNKSVDPLPYVRPSTAADALLGRGPGARKQAVVISPNNFRWATYVVDRGQLSGQAPYKVNLKFVTQMVPVNLLGEIAEVGFDYGMSPKQVANEVVDRSQTLWDKTIVLPSKPVVIDIKPGESDITAPPYKPFLTVATTRAPAPAAAAKPTTKVAEAAPLSRN